MKIYAKDQLINLQTSPSIRLTKTCQKCIANGGVLSSLSNTLTYQFLNKAMILHPSNSVRSKQIKRKQFWKHEQQSSKAGHISHRTFGNK